MTVEVFLALSEDPEIDSKITSKEQELQAAQKAAQLQAKSLLASIPVPNFPASFAEVLAKTISSLAKDAQSRINEHMRQHNMRENGEPWLTEGLSYLTNELCPFCSQNIRANELIKSYTDYFSEAYYNLRNEVGVLRDQINNLLSDQVSAQIDRLMAQNNSDIEFWRQYCAITPPELINTKRSPEVIRALRERAVALLEKKQAAPLDNIRPDEAFTQALRDLESLCVAINNYNSMVAAANAIISSKKLSVQNANIRTIESEIAVLRAQKSRHSTEIRQLCESESTKQADKQNLENEKGRVKSDLDAHTQRVITQYGQSINNYLDRINAGFRITTPTHTYRGGSPSTSYQIVINQNAVDIGDSDTPQDRPSFRNTLSAGDKSTLALAFFLAQLEQDPNRANKIVVFDDPFTSLDSFRRSHTIHQIYKCSQASLQVIVLSHDPNFLKLLWDRLLPVDRKTLQIARVGEENATIVEWDIEKAVMARYRAQIEDLQIFYSDGTGQIRDVIQKIRPILEGYCQTLYPIDFSDQDTLGVIVGKIRAAGAAHSLASIADDLDEINIYCRRYHHAENLNAATESIDEPELQGYVKRTLKLVGCLL